VAKWGVWEICRLPKNGLEIKFTFLTLGTGLTLILLSSCFFHYNFSGYDQYWDVQYRNGQWNNDFIFQVGVEISDHPLTAHLSSFPVNVALKVGTLIMQGIFLFILWPHIAIMYIQKT
jgi:hypothetical protein